MNSGVFGPYAWNVLHRSACVAHHHPVAFATMVCTFSVTMPCSFCRNSFRGFLRSECERRGILGQVRAGDDQVSPTSTACFAEQECVSWTVIRALGSWMTHASTDDIQYFVVALHDRVNKKLGRPAAGARSPADFELQADGEQRKLGDLGVETERVPSASGADAGHGGPVRESMPAIDLEQRRNPLNESHRRDAGARLLRLRQRQWKERPFPVYDILELLGLFVRGIGTLPSPENAQHTLATIAVFAQSLGELMDATFRKREGNAPISSKDYHGEMDTLLQQKYVSFARFLQLTATEWRCALRRGLLFPRTATGTSSAARAPSASLGTAVATKQPSFEPPIDICPVVRCMLTAATRLFSLKPPSLSSQSHLPNTESGVSATTPWWDSDSDGRGGGWHLAHVTRNARSLLRDERVANYRTQHKEQEPSFSLHPSSWPHVAWMGEHPVFGAALATRFMCAIDDSDSREDTQRIVDYFSVFCAKACRHNRCS